MPTYPWRRIIAPDRERTYSALLGIVQLPNIGMLPTFLFYGARIERQLLRTEGVIGYRTRSELIRLRFYHLSAWTDRNAIQGFIRGQPHHQAMTTLYGRLGLTLFRYWEVPGSVLPLSFDEHMLHLTEGQDRDV